MVSQGQAQAAIQESARGQQRQGRERAGTRLPEHTRGVTHWDTDQAGRGTACAIAVALPAHIPPTKGQGKNGTNPDTLQASAPSQAGNKHCASRRYVEYHKQEERI